MSEVKRGRVKFFNFLKGFGFICLDDEDYFVHVTDIENGDILLENEEVEFQAVQGSKGWQAIKVQRLEAPSMVDELGTVKFYDESKGYGFVEREGKADVFAHFTDLLPEFRSRGMHEGDRVTFSVRNGRDGRDRAYKIKIQE